MIDILAANSRIFRKIRSHLFLPGLLALLAGCSDPITRVAVVGPEPYTVPSFNYLIFTQSAEQTWNRVLKEFSQSDFRVEEVDSGGRFLQVSLDGPPDRYIDCGKKTIETLDGGDAGKKIQIENAASQYRYKVWRRNHLDTYVVRNAFAGEAGIFVFGDEKQSKIIVQYDLMLKVRVDYTTTQGQRFAKTTEKVLHIKAGEEQYFEAFGATCRSTGKFEKEIRDILTADANEQDLGTDARF